MHASFPLYYPDERLGVVSQKNGPSHCPTPPIYPQPKFVPPLHSKSPYFRVPLPSQSDKVGNGPILLHPLLRPCSSINWNVTWSPRLADEVPLPCFDDVATQPPLPSLSLKHHSLPWSVTVHATGMRGVTVADILRTVCSVLQEWDDGSGGMRGMKKFEYLRGRTRLVGLSASGEDVWEMRLEK
ncbi:hypothetical protein Moror_8179 [Moniliophthora roreri MCA 2997]|uniref:DUF6699 domain-containing protein n=1 Tax=Moniliophthora roreri (strain MCA 2997) TaxID=1381753 RepID=V2XP92_MONRO|nr:hypothetical protein Moror_8179 [Moniliophthora roreri MCA 2997]